MANDLAERLEGLKAKIDQGKIDRAALTQRKKDSSEKLAQLDTRLKEEYGIEPTALDDEIEKLARSVETSVTDAEKMLEMEID